jgi:hypothetical protein
MATDRLGSLHILHELYLAGPLSRHELDLDGLSSNDTRAVEESCPLMNGCLERHVRECVVFQ